MRDEARIEAFALDAVANRPPTVRARAPVSPSRFLAASTTAVPAPGNWSVGGTASRTIITIAHTTVTKATDPSTARGRLRSGSLISSATLVIFTNPRQGTNTSAVAGRIAP